MHGGFVLYNGGFTAGLTALVLLPILDFYKIKPKYSDDVMEVSNKNILAQDSE